MQRGAFGDCVEMRLADPGCRMIGLIGQLVGGQLAEQPNERAQRGAY